VAAQLEEEFFMLKFMNYMLYELPGPKIIKFNHSINLQKCLMPFYIIFLMLYYNNFSDAMFYYFILHGSYGKTRKNLSIVGVMWFIKDSIFPDPSFQVKMSPISAGLTWLTVLGPYLVPAYRLASG